MMCGMNQSRPIYQDAQASGRAIENHGIIGDLRTVALVALDGTIDFCCWPRFDSPSIFAALLGGDQYGAFALAPDIENATKRQLYLHETNVLLTRFLSSGGIAEVSDFMSIDDADGGQRLVRRARAIRNRVRFRMRCEPQFDYARADHEAFLDADTVVFASAGPPMKLRLRASVPLAVESGAAIAEFELEAGDAATFVLEDAELVEPSIAVDSAYAVRAFKTTSNFWRDWTEKSSYRGRWQESVRRSALVLKLLTSREHGSIVAAATFGLPEVIGGNRNWDYRYTWARDAAFTVYAFLRLGYTDEADAFVRWLGVRAAHMPADGSKPVMFRVDGATDLTESSLDHMSGYRGSVPVLVGNAASTQVQLDVQGDIMDAIYLSDKYGEQISWSAWEGITRATDWTAEHWQDADEGIWEIRGQRRKLLHSRLMCWVALDRAVRLARKRSLPAPLVRWSSVRDEIYRTIHEKFWNERLQAFTQSEGSDALDASCLLMPLVRFISPTDPRWLSTLAAVGETLTDDSLVYRYTANAEFDGLADVEGTFNMCSFWYIECIARAGDLKRAQFLFEKMLGYANHVGLFAEEIGPAGEHLGNFPQAFTHLALISAAFYLDRALG